MDPEKPTNQNSGLKSKDSPKSETHALFRLQLKFRQSYPQQWPSTRPPYSRPPPSHSSLPSCICPYSRRLFGSISPLLGFRKREYGEEERKIR
ncbi:hypothetical protein L1887_34526 [Cichorium endivia]|nr:hypothetical protein L1887_34526 [Cichorium endivia]